MTVNNQAATPVRTESTTPRKVGSTLILLGLGGIVLLSIFNARQGANTKAAKQEAHEAQLEKMHGIGFDQGYVEAVIDSYLGDPLYMLTEEHNGEIKLWKKTPLDPVYSKRINEQSSKHHD